MNAVDIGWSGVLGRVMETIPQNHNKWTLFLRLSLGAIPSISGDRSLALQIQNREWLNVNQAIQALEAILIEMEKKKIIYGSAIEKMIEAAIKPDDFWNVVPLGILSPVKYPFYASHHQ